MKKTQQEIENLKQNWKNDPCWNIEDTEGFEDHYDELKAFREKWMVRWEKIGLENDILSNPHQGAFARPVSSLSGEETSSDQKGLTKRELIAAMAMQGILGGRSVGDTHGAEFIASLSVMCADALLLKLATTSR